MASREVLVKVADLPAVQDAMRQIANERDDLRGLVQQFEQRVVCLQCGQRYVGTSACGPSHAVVARLVKGSD